MAKINKKELKSITDRYMYYLENEKESSELLQGMKIVLMELNLIDTIELEIFKKRNSSTVNQILENLQGIFKKYKMDFKIKLLDDYLYDADYLGLTEDDARALKGSINYINNYSI